MLLRSHPENWIHPRSQHLVGGHSKPDVVFGVLLTHTSLHLWLSHFWIRKLRLEKACVAHLRPHREKLMGWETELDTSLNQGVSLFSRMPPLSSVSWVPFEGKDWLDSWRGEEECTRDKANVNKRNTKQWEKKNTELRLHPGSAINDLRDEAQIFWAPTPCTNSLQTALWDVDWDCFYRPELMTDLKNDNLKNDRMISVISKANHAISRQSTTMPQPVTLKKLKLNGSMKTYKTF